MNQQKKRLSGVDDNTKNIVLNEINRAEKATASSLATDSETGEKDAEAEKQMHQITRMMGDLLRGQLFGKQEMKGEY
ncbi:hypothetical protein [Halomontanus rarus]|uniref:hypothetical protein n=1 Tax=Halomontanus rarus TaxID=3034020 RepID=UPI001A99E0C9